jgi:signal transduction histidine kinase
VAEVRYEMEVKAAALMHDTVLNHLAVVAGADSGRIDPALRSAIERDVQLLLSDEWLTDDATAGIEDLGTVWIESELFVVIQEARADGMLIDVSGDLDAIGRLDPARSAAVALAARQSLVNVMSHANTDRAEVVVLGADGAVSVMVIDGGSGFDPDDVAPDRLGIRQSIRARIETVGGEVEVWSTKGRGTSVLIRVPERTDESARRNSASRDSAIGDSVG